MFFPLHYSVPPLHQHTWPPHSQSKTYQGSGAPVTHCEYCQELQPTGKCGNV